MDYTICNIIVAVLAYSAFATSNHLKIGTVLQDPYVFTQNDSETHYGFMIDLLDQLSQRLHFSYSISTFDSYGSFDPETQLWDGLIGELIKNQNDPHAGIQLAAAAMSVTASREAVVDFIKPFQSVGNSVLMRKRVDPEDAPFHLTLFKSLSPAVWVCIAIACCLISVLLWLMNTFNPYDFGCRYSLGLADKTEAELFGLKSSFWFCFNLLFLQGYERSPRSLASKIMVGSWMLFITISLSFLIASLTRLMIYQNFMPRHPRYPQVTDLYHLITSPLGYKVGTLRNSQTYEQLTSSSKSESQFLKKYWNEEGTDYLVDSIESGLQRVDEDEMYALVLDSLTAAYWANKRPCHFTVVGPALDRKRVIALAMPINSLDLELFHQAVLELVEIGEIAELEKRWFLNKNECWNETQASNFASAQANLFATRESTRMDVRAIWGAFVFMIVGLLTCCVVAILEIAKPRLKDKIFSRQIERHGQSLDVSEDGFM